MVRKDSEADPLHSSRPAKKAASKKTARKSASVKVSKLAVSKRKADSTLKTKKPARKSAKKQSVSSFLQKIKTLHARVPSNLASIAMVVITIAGSLAVLTSANSPLQAASAASASTLTGCASPAQSVWTEYSTGAQTGSFTAAFDATANAAGTDALVGLSNSVPTDYTDLSAIVRFSSATGRIDMRDGGSYTAATAVPYVAQEPYHFRMVVNVPARTYSVYVTPPGRSEELLGANYVFRTEAATPTSINHWTPFVDVGAFTVCNFAVTAGTTTATPTPTTTVTPAIVTVSTKDTQAPSVPQNISAVPGSQTTMFVKWNSSTDNVGVKGYSLYQDGRLVVKTTSQTPDYTVTGLVAPTRHTYTVSAYDAAGNTSGQSAGAVGSIAATTTVAPTPTPTPTPAPAPTPTPTPTPTLSGSYDQTVLADHPVAFWDVDSQSGSETDLTGDGHTGTYKNGTPSAATLPNGDHAADFNGSTQYLAIPSSNAFSIPTTGNLTWEAWVRADTLSFPKESSDGYTDFMGKCANYSPNCEWESRMYGAGTSQGRDGRFSAYAFNPSAGLGSAADWQPSTGVISAGQWVHVVGEYTTQSQPSGCSTSAPGSLNIWVNGVLWSQASHAPTGCMSQYGVRPQAGSSPLYIGTMALDYMFKGAVGKVAIYNYLLSQSRIDAHYTAMTGKTVTGSCGATCHF